MNLFHRFGYHPALILFITLAIFGCGARIAYHQGEEFAEHEKWDSAVAKYQQAVTKNPKKTEYKIKLIRAKLQASEYHYQLALEAMKSGNFNIAIEELESALRYNPFNKSAIYALTKARNKKQAVELHKKALDLEKENKLDSAFNTIDSAFNLDPESEIIKTDWERIKKLYEESVIKSSLESYQILYTSSKPINLNIENTSTKQIFDVLAKDGGHLFHYG